MTDSAAGRTADHRRQPPRERFAGTEHLFDLAAEATALEGEPTGERDGHRQIALFARDELTIILFDFDAGGYLLEHSADGQVMIQVLHGELQVTTTDEDRRMPAGSLLVLAPGVRHDVHAIADSRMLLTVCL